MKKSVRIRKAGPGEKPGYYNKTANFLNKALPKANQGLQVQERLKVIMNDTYASLRDGADPNTIFETLVTKYGIEQKMAFAIINRVMTVLAQKGYKDPAYLEEEEEEDTAQGNNPQAANPTPQPTPQPAPTNTNDDEDIALAESDMPSGYDGMQHLDSGSEQYAQQGAFQYGGYYDYGGEYEDDYTNYFEDADSPQDAVIDQYSNPGKLSAEEEIPFDLSRLIKFTPGAQNIPQTPDLSYYLGSYRPVADEGNIPQDLLPANKYGGLNKFAGGGPGPGKGKRGRKAKTQAKPKTRETVVEPVEPTVAPVESVGPQRTVTPQESAVTPSIWQNYQNFFGKRNPLSDRGFFGTRVENLGTVLNTVRPQNWREKWREQVAPSTTTTKIITDINALIENDKYEPSVLQKNADNTYSTGLGFNLDPALADFLLKSTEEFNMLSNKKKPTEIDIQSLGALLGGVGMPESIAPELDFLSIHKQNNGKLKFTKDENGLFKVEILSEVPTRLKGYNKSSIKLKDEIIIDPKTKEILDPKTKLPLEIVDKNYYMGNQLNWYNSPYRFPFTSKFPGLDLSKYPQIISESPLKKEPVSGWNTAWNMIGKPMAFSPMSFPFTYPRFAERSKFYPNASNVKTQYFGKQREIGPQAPGGMTFGDQPFGAQYADYSLLKDRNYKTGLGFLKTAGILGGLGYLGYNQFLQEPDKDFIYDRGMDQFVPVSNEKFEGAGRVGNDPTFGITRSGMDKDSMIIQGGDTINDKGWGKLISDDFKRGGAQKKQFVKNVMSKFAPGGELGKGNRMDNGKVSEKKNNFVTKLKAQSDKVVTEDLYAAVQKSGDPQLMNIFMGNNQQQQPQDNQMMQQPQFGEMGGYVNMDVENPLTRFIYGGDEDPAFYEPYSLPEAGGGITMPPGGSGGQYIADKMSPALDQNTFETNPNNDDIVENPTTKCPPGTMWSKTYNQCVPIMQYKLNPKVVRGRSSLANTLIPINPIFRSYLTDQPKTSRRDNPYSRKNLRQFGKEDRYRVLPMLLARDAGRGDRGFNSYGMQQFLSRSLPFGAFLQPKYNTGGISDPSEGDLNLPASSFSQSGYDPSTYAPQSTEVQNLNATENFRDINYLNNSMFPGVNNTQEKPNDTNYYDPTQYRKVTQMDGEAFNNGLNAVANFTSGMINNLQNNPRSLATTYQATNLFNQVPITNEIDRLDQQDIGQNIGFRGPEQGSERNSRGTFGNYPGVSKYGGYMEYGGFADPYNDEEIYMTDEEIQDYLARGGEIEYL